MNFEYETEEIAYEDNEFLDSFTIEDGSNSFTGGAGDGNGILVDENGCIWNIDVMITFNEIEITVEVAQESFDEFDYEYIDLSPSGFEEWASQNGISLRD